MKPKYLLIFCLLFIAVLSCKKTEESVIPKSTKKEITANPTVEGKAGSSVGYDAATFTYTINVSAGTDVKALKLIIRFSHSATIALALAESTSSMDVEPATSQDPFLDRIYRLLGQCVHDTTIRVDC